MESIRCGWCGSDPLYQRYHDEEWGVPVRDDRLWFEFLILEGFQAGLSWYTVLQKRDHFREVFHQFDPELVARLDDSYLESLRHDTGIIRNRLKIEASRTNARAFLDVQAEYGSFDAYIWQFTDGQTLQPQRQTLREVPAHTPISDRMSKALKQRGFKFIGSTICYAFMQASGMVNDHITDCFRHDPCRELGKQ